MFLRHIVESITTITVIPLRGGRFDEPHKAVGYFPLVGALLGLAIYGVLRWVNGFSGAWPEAVAFFGVLLAVGLTGALHLDGLADTADALFGTRERNRALEIMKDKSLGTFGTTAIVVVLFAKWIFLTRLLALEASWVVVAAFIVSRFGLSFLCALYPYARKEGGTGLHFIDRCGIRQLLLAFILALSLSMLFTGWAGLVALAAGLLMVALLGYWFSRRLGGVTGDTLGAAAEVMEALLLGAGAFFFHFWSATDDFGILFRI